ncbi:uncharacterized protein SPSK_04642 [Sporothrix schenckii 1099-18]|uniref:Uncharacterized protein n=1 Tax=Sporothrix schenckii 1099-18 TaxID=1397361 RepID=A0A0F2M2P7_SPOSC|nr:uncharacterized protein SPSK_04642 [Sporothrix schenckii 1099-18]KJR83389.1 hypothetical protein SPSK_04642 [Sporothrix schenckii 1099-18]
MDNQRANTFPTILPASVLTIEGFREIRIARLKEQIPQVPDEDTKRNLEFVLQYYENGGTPPPNNETWLVHDGKFVTLANGDRATMRTIGSTAHFQGFTMESGVYRQGLQTTLLPANGAGP